LSQLVERFECLSLREFLFPGWCRAHVEAIIVAIDQYAEAATGNRDYFLNKPHSIDGRRVSSDIP
jgi:hypothetical protein